MSILKGFMICCAVLVPVVFAEAQSSALQDACAADAQRLCSNVQPGGGRIVACLKQHMAQVSDGCKRAAGVPATSSGSSTPAASAPTTSPNSIDGGADASTSSPGARAPRSTLSQSASPAAARTAGFATSTVPAGPRGAKIKFVQRDIIDVDHDNMRAETLYIPETWNFQSKLTWHYDTVWYPVSSTVQAEDPVSVEAYFQYPVLRMTYTEVPPQLRQYTKQSPGMAPLQPSQALAMFIKKARPNAPNLKWIGKQDLPEMAKAYGLPEAPNQHGVAIKIGYDYQGKPVEEAFFAVYYLSQGSNPGVNAGQIKQTVWGLQLLQSFRAPAGELEKNMGVFGVISKSIYVNPEWIKLKTQLTDQMAAAFQAKLKQGYDQIAASKAAAQQIMAQAAAFDKNFEAQESKFRNTPGVDDSWLRDSGGSSGGHGGSLSAADNFSNLMRQEDTVRDPSAGGNTNLSSGAVHYGNGLGDYRTYDDPNMTPGKAGESGTWTQLETIP